MNKQIIKNKQDENKIFIKYNIILYIIVQIYFIH